MNSIIAKELKRKRVKLYKYMSLKDIERFAQIIDHGGFYAAKYLQMNDPMEAFLDFEPLSEDPDEAKKAIAKRKEVADVRAKTRLVSFSKASPFCVESLPLWAYYADGFEGACIEIEKHQDMIDNTAEKPDLNWRGVEVEYVDNLPIVPNDAPIEECFKNKLKSWEYEKEVRFINVRQQDNEEETWYETPIGKIILGYKVSNVTLKKIREIIAPTWLGINYQMCKKLRNIPKSDFVYRVTKGEVQDMIVKGQMDGYPSDFYTRYREG